MVHGTSDGIGAFCFVEPVLAERYEVWVYDRRGRGDSGDGDDYGLEREVEDLLAVIAATGATPHVVAHSFGALIALRAAATTDVDLRSLTLYEPPLVTEEIPSDAVEEVNAAVERGDHEHAFTTMASQLAGFRDEELALVRSIPPLWEELLETVPTVPRELSEIRSVDWEPGTVPLSDVPVRMIRGGRDSSPVYPAVEDLPRWVSDPEVVTIPGQGHMATAFAPYDFADAVLDFIDRH
jgi:pimeloyl-ACP methyl ester carboxylesterase